MSDSGEQEWIRFQTLIPGQKEFDMRRKQVSKEILARVWLISLYDTLPSIRFSGKYLTPHQWMRFQNLLPFHTEFSFRFKQVSFKKLSFLILVMGKGILYH